MGPADFGAGLGIARGQIVIDTSSLERTQSIANSVGANVARSFGQVDTSINRTIGGVGRLNQSLGGLGGALGGFGAFRIAQFVLQADSLATAYRRQGVAAANLAGGQEKLNELLEAYDKATGRAVATADQMAEVTRLQAIGFADSAQELDEFVTAARGASLAMGRSQDYIISQLQIAIANQSKLRLDQLGLGISEVEARIRRLRAADKGLTDEMAYQDAVLGLLQEKFGGLVRSQEAQATGAEKMAKAWKDASLEIGEAFGPEISTALEGTSTQITGISRILRDLKTDIDNVKRGLREEGGIGSNSWLSDLLNFDLSFGLNQMELTTRPGQGLALTQRRDYRSWSATAGGIYPGGPGYMPSPTLGGVDQHYEERRQEQIDFGRELADIERSANAQRLDATQQYESQRSQIVETYGRQMAREEEDFLRQRGRAVAEFNRQVANLQSEAAERDAEWASDLAERIADIQSDGNERISEIEENYQRDRERREQDHRDRLFDAASRLDAVAVANEQRNYRRQSQDAQERHDEQIDKERENIAERIADEQHGHAERLADARKADAERLEDMREAFARQTAQEDEDRAVRLQRMAEDHAAQLAQMDAAQALRIEQINRHEAEERKTAEEAHIKAMGELGETLSEGWLRIQKGIEAVMLKEAEDFEKRIKEKYDVNNAERGTGATRSAGLPGYASGGWVNRTGPAMVHAGEYVLSPQIAAMAAAMRGGSMNVGGINIYGATDPVAVANEVDSRLRQFYQALRN